jgi:hypothetical protein
MPQFGKCVVVTKRSAFTNLPMRIKVRISGILLSNSMAAAAVKEIYASSGYVTASKNNHALMLDRNSVRNVKHGIGVHAWNLYRKVLVVRRPEKDAPPPVKLNKILLPNTMCKNCRHQGRDPYACIGQVQAYV